MAMRALEGDAWPGVEEVGFRLPADGLLLSFVGRERRYRFAVEPECPSGGP